MCARPCSFQCESLQQEVHKAETLPAEQQFQISSGSAAHANSVSLLSSMQDYNLIVNHRGPTFKRNAENLSDCSNAHISNRLCVPEIEKDIFSIPSSPTAISSLRSHELQSKACFSTSERKNDSKLHPRCQEILHDQVSRLIWFAISFTISMNERNTYGQELQVDGACQFASIAESL
jgi:hypothetical protein